MGLVFGTGLGQLIPLGLYVAAIAAALREHLATARRLTAGNLALGHRLDEAEPLIARRIEFGEQTIGVRRQSGFAAARGASQN